MRACFVLLLVLAAGCARGPDAESVREDVVRRLGEALPKDTLSVADVDRRGSQSDSRAPAGRTRRVVYFDAELTLLRDFDFGAWDAPGVAALVSALGAGPRGIEGLRSGGNRKGDRLRAHGTVVYERGSDGWTPAVPGGFEPAVAPSVVTGGPRGLAAILDAMRQVIESVPRDASPAQREAIAQELSAAHAAIRARLARLLEGYAVAAGPEHGQYLRFVTALSAGRDVRTVPLVTRGGEENLRLLRANRVALALAQGDSALAAYRGTGPFADDGPHPGLRAVGSLYPEPVHVLARADGGLAAAGELKGRRVAIGERGSASRWTALRVLQAHGIELKDITPLELPLGEALAALRDRRADAVIQVIGVPADSIRDALARTPLRLLPLSEGAVQALARAGEGYFPFEIPRGSYALQGEGVRTVATAALLVTGGALSGSEVAGITRYVFEESRDFARGGSAQGTQVSVATARLGLSIALHDAAERTLEEMARARQGR